MGRALRIQAADAVYHVTTRGVRRRPVYEDPIDYGRFEKLLGELVSKRQWAVHAYCLMPNHFHLLFGTPRADISDGMCWLNGVYARWFNSRRDYTGHLFEARFHSELVRTNAHLLNLACYIPLNPVRANLCRTPAEWPWSSYLATTGRASNGWLSPSWLLEQFGSDQARAAAEYERYVESRRLSG
jgi:putative transposase